MQLLLFGNNPKYATRRKRSESVGTPQERRRVRTPRAYYVQKTVEKGKIEVILVPIKIKSATTTTTSGKNGVERRPRRPCRRSKSGRVSVGSSRFLAHGFRLAAPVTRRRRPVFARTHTVGSRGLGLTNRVSTEARAEEQVRTSAKRRGEPGRASASEDLGEQVQR